MYRILKGIIFFILRVRRFLPYKLDKNLQQEKIEFQILTHQKFITQNGGVKLDEYK